MASLRKAAGTARAAPVRRSPIVVARSLERAPRSEAARSSGLVQNSAQAGTAVSDRQAQHPIAASMDRLETSQTSAQDRNSASAQTADNSVGRASRTELLAGSAQGWTAARAVAPGRFVVERNRDKPAKPAA